jgi:phosphomannomutase
MDHRQIARTWMGEDPDPVTRDEVQRLLDLDDLPGLADRFGSRLAFGTAGLRGALGAGPNRMNRALVRRVTAGLADRVLQGPGTERTVVVGRDARHGSDVFAADAAAVLVGAGITAYVFADVVPTPLVAHAVRVLEADAGIVITASHNPPGDNGYKVFGPGGRQISSPLDEEISDAVDAVGTLLDVPLAPPDSSSIRPVPADVVTSYDEGVQALVDEGPRDLRIVYSALHGVAGQTCTAALRRAGFSDVTAVPQQQQPDPDFPTVAFPNPEEPGAMDLAIALAESVDADLVLANDPDGDRIAVGVPTAGGWRLLTGDEIGVLVAEDVLARGALTRGRRPHVATTVVSSSLLSAVAAHHGAGYVETLTGFKWLSRAAAELADDPTDAGGTMVLAYEQALGVSVGDLVRDKDGIGAAVVVADLVARAKAGGRTPIDLLDDLARRHGAHVTAGRSVELSTGSGADEDAVQVVLDGLRATPPTELAGSPIAEVWDHDAGVVTRDDGSVEAIALPSTPLLRYVAEDGTRVMVRPSGTEPKLKFYGEAIVASGDPGTDRATAAARVAQVLEGFTARALER